jgi:excisionase family DNA binding protein
MTPLSAVPTATLDVPVECIVLTVLAAARASNYSQSAIRKRCREGSLASIELSPGRLGILTSDAALLHGPSDRDGRDDLRELFADRGFLRPSEVAQALGCSTRTLERLIRRGELPTQQVGGYRLIAASELREWLLARRKPCRWEATR